jgi:hypothetical protein
MKMIWMVLVAAGAFLTGCARDQAEAQWSALDANGYRAAEPLRPDPYLEKERDRELQRERELQKEREAQKELEEPEEE